MSATREPVSVVVTGPTGCGKSAIMGEIEIALKAVGVPVETDADFQSEKNMTGADWHEALDLYKPTVRLTEVNQPGRKWDRQKVCDAARAASVDFGQWVPQQWLDLFMNHYEHPGDPS